MHCPYCDVVHVKGFVDVHSNTSYKQGDGTGCPVHV